MSYADAMEMRATEAKLRKMGSWLTVKKNEKGARINWETALVARAERVSDYNIDRRTSILYATLMLGIVPNAVKNKARALRRGCPRGMVVTECAYVTRASKADFRSIVTSEFCLLAPIKRS